MRKNKFYITVILLLYLVAVKTVAAQSVISQHFPLRHNIGILCWSIPDQASGFLSQVVVFETERNGNSKMLWQSPLDNSYSPQMHFLPEITVQGLPLVLVQRQTGAASSELDVVGKDASRFAVLFHTDGFKFEIAPLDGSKLPLIIAHRDASILDVPDIYRWSGSRFLEDSAAHPRYYRELLAQDRKTVPREASAPVLVSLSRIAVLSGDRVAAKEILDHALAKERSKGRDADPATLRQIDRAMRSLMVNHP